MSKDAKLGLVLGVGLIIIIAVVFFRKDPSQAKAATESTAASVKPKNTLETPMVSDVRIAAARRHTVTEGDSLFSIAQRYYEDPTKFVRIYDANREALTAPDRLTPGTVLVIPE
jgi:nucleoid-associated protein YgaU